ncbi:ABC transporter substrate-binding protein [Paenibacillus sp. GYB003]|uniref:ABC transporter substrate-binding protein n=1 Tax=Paenibacillus sp. GYB003 TaxID=2994392 RepID=UPI002F96D460
MLKKKAALLSALTAVLGLTPGCGGQERPGDAPTDQDPITLHVFQAGAGITDTEFKELIADPVKKKYPHLTLELLRETKETNRNDLVASGRFPDLIFTSSLGVPGFLDIGLASDLNELIDKSKTDLNAFEKRAIDEIKAFGKDGQVYALPFSLNGGVMFYNKTIFDRAGLPYPKDGMTWEETIELAKKLALKVPDVRALSNEGGIRVAEDMRLPYADPDTQKAAVNSDKWKYLFRILKDINDIPDNKNAKGALAGFQKDQTVAMYTNYLGRLGEFEEMKKQGIAIDWDMVSMPVLKDDPQGMQTEAHVLMISSMSKQRETAFQVVRFLSSDEEVQTRVAKKARISSLKDDKFKQMFGSELTALQGKNVQSVFKTKYGPNAYPSNYNTAIRTIGGKKLAEYYEGKDANSALREWEEEANKAIAEAKAAGK